jgi:predicted ATPase
MLAALAARGVRTEEEVARAVLKAPGGMAMHEDRPADFGAAMLAGEIDAFQRTGNFEGTVIFDRGLPDTVGFFELEGLAIPDRLERACLELRYDGPIFRAPPWRGIYEVDEQRVQTWTEAVASDAAVVAAWRRFGYEPIDLPLAEVGERVEFVLERIALWCDRR